MANNLSIKLFDLIIESNLQSVLNELSSIIQYMETKNVSNSERDALEMLRDQVLSALATASVYDL